MARPNNAPMGAWFKKMNKDWLIRLLVDEIQKNSKLEEEIKILKEELSKKSMENWFDKKANNMFEEEGERYKSQKENILMGKIC